MPILSDLFIDATHNVSASLSRKQGVDIRFEAVDKPNVTGNTITLPDLPRGVLLEDELVNQYRAFIDVKSGEIRHSDRQQIDRFVENNKEDEALVSIHQILEDEWVERKVIDEYAGSRSSLDNSLSSFNKKIAEDVPDMSEVSADSILFGLHTQGRKGYSDVSPLKEGIDNLNENVKKFTPKFIEELDKCESTSDVIGLSKAIRKLIDDDPELESDPEDFDPSDQQQEQQEKGEQEQEQPEGEEEEGEGETSEGEGKGEGAAEQVREEGGSDSEETKERKERLKVKFKPYTDDENDKSSGPIDIDYGDIKLVRNSKEAFNILSTEGDQVHRVHSNQPNNLGRRARAIKSHILGKSRVFKQKLRRLLLSEDNRDWDPSKEQGRLDSKRLASVVTGNRNVFKTRDLRDDVNTAVTVLVDMSGSMYGGRMDLAKETAILFVEALQGTGVNLSVCGFRSCSGVRQTIDLPSGAKYHRTCGHSHSYYKDFDTSAGKAINAIASMEAGGGNTDRDGLNRAYLDLKKRPEERKILLVFSDGHPAWGSHGVTGQELTQSLRNITSHIQDEGEVELIGIGIQSDSVKMFYDDNVVINNVEDLTKTSFKQLERILLKRKRR